MAAPFNVLRVARLHMYLHKNVYLAFTKAYLQFFIDAEGI